MAQIETKVSANRAHAIDASKEIMNPEEFHTPHDVAPSVTLSTGEQVTENQFFAMREELAKAREHMEEIDRDRVATESQLRNAHDLMALVKRQAEGNVWNPEANYARELAMRVLYWAHRTDRCEDVERALRVAGIDPEEIEMPYEAVAEISVTLPIRIDVTGVATRQAIRQESYAIEQNASFSREDIAVAIEQKIRLMVSEFETDEPKEVLTQMLRRSTIDYTVENVTDATVTRPTFMSDEDDERVSAIG
jgi:hypothetical protein